MSRRRISNSNAYLVIALALIFGAGFLYFNAISPKVLSDYDEFIGFDETTLIVKPTPTTSPTPLTTPAASATSTPTPEPTSIIADDDKEPFDFFNRSYEELTSLYNSASSTAGAQLGINSSEEIKLKKIMILTEARYQKVIEQIGYVINENRDEYTPEKLRNLLFQYNALKVNLDGFEKAQETIESGQDLSSTVNIVAENSEALRLQIIALINNLGVE
ncbi:MAG: hypothetical protein QG570_291 [Patescibacteria group bacterium]|nr:hypothetical protein [Patescibacteria group bacterium]